MRKRQWYLVGFLTVVVILVLVALTGAHGSDAGNPGRNGNLLEVSKRPPRTSYAPGIPAITPRMKSVSGAPTYTRADVEHYLTTYSWESASLATHQTVIVKIAFITAHEASVLLKGEFIGRPDTALVCYVELHGTFVVIGGPPPGIKPVTVHRVVYIFDAQTGNILIRGIGN